MCRKTLGLLELQNLKHMIQELEELIDLALADGILTDKEKEVIFKKAKTLGVDIDEVEMVLDAKLFLATNKTTMTPKTEKLGDIKKCPSCGANVAAFSSSCGDCGFEFRNVGANNSVKALSEKLESIVEECNKMSFSDGNIIGRIVDSKLRQDERREIEIIDRQQQVITNFPIPNTKEDILELLYFIKPKTQIGFSSDKNVNAWRSKFSEIISRADVAFASDGKILSEIAKFDDQQKSSLILRVINKFNELPKKAKSIIPLLLFTVFGGIIMGICSSYESKEVQKEKVRLEQIVSKVDDAIRDKNYDEAEILTSQLKWEYSSSFSPTETDKLSKSWDEKKEEMLNTIHELKK
jgi:hypothetical protein